MAGVRGQGHFSHGRGSRTQRAPVLSSGQEEWVGLLPYEFDLQVLATSSYFVLMFLGFWKPHRHHVAMTFALRMAMPKALQRSIMYPYHRPCSQGGEPQTATFHILNWKGQYSKWPYLCKTAFGCVFPFCERLLNSTKLSLIIYFCPMFSHVSTCFHMFPHVSTFFHMFPHFSTFFRIFPHFSTFFHSFPQFSIDSCPNVPSLSEKPPDPPRDQQPSPLMWLLISDRWHQAFGGSWFEAVELVLCDEIYRDMMHVMYIWSTYKQHIYVCAYVYIYIYIHTYVFIYVYICVSRCIFIFIRIYVYIYVYIYMVTPPPQNPPKHQFHDVWQWLNPMCLCLLS